MNKITFDTDEEKEYVFHSLGPPPLFDPLRERWLALDITTADVKANCGDLKVLGKGDFKALLKWRLALREEVYSSPSWTPGF